MGMEITKAADLPEHLGDVWVAEALIDGNGAVTFHVGRLVDALGMNELQVRHGWSSGYVPFALCWTMDEAYAACERMKHQQAERAALGEVEQPGQTVPPEGQQHEAA